VSYSVDRKNRFEALASVLQDAARNPALRRKGEARVVVRGEGDENERYYPNRYEILGEFRECPHRRTRVGNPPLRADSLNLESKGGKTVSRRRRRKAVQQVISKTELERQQAASQLLVAQNDRASSGADRFSSVYHSRKQRDAKAVDS
jgi:hypothetical protein